MSGNTPKQRRASPRAATTARPNVDSQFMAAVDFKPPAPPRDRQDDEKWAENNYESKRLPPRAKLPTPKPTPAWEGTYAPTPAPTTEAPKMVTVFKSYPKGALHCEVGPSGHTIVHYTVSRE